jgi:hypothetical protein
LCYKLSVFPSVHRKLDAILKGVRNIMALSQQVLDVLAQLDSATNAVAARIQAQITTLQQLHPDDTDIIAALQAEVTTLNGLAANPANPVPAPPAPPAAS